jgi:HNH endonuclease
VVWDLEPAFARTVKAPRACIISNSQCSDGKRALPGTSLPVQKPHPLELGALQAVSHRRIPDDAMARPDRKVKREQPVCYAADCIAPSSEVDHIIPVHQCENLAYERSNVRGICSQHHRQRSASQGGEGPRRNGGDDDTRRGGVNVSF